MTQTTKTTSANPPETAARILYTADTLGYFYPCASCGNNAQGGLARRAALLRQLAGTIKNPLVIAGPNEFTVDGQGRPSEDEGSRMRAIRDALERMPYSGIAVSPAAAEAFKRYGIPPLKNGIHYGGKPVTEYYRAGRLTAACIFFPPAEGEGPSRVHVEAVLAAAREAADNAQLVIGISPWGIYAENSLMERFSGFFHVLLGGGRGIAVPGQAMNSGTTPGPLWVRSDKTGRAVSVLDIYAIPAKGEAWLEGIHFSARLIFLEKNLPEDGEVAKIVNAIPKD